MPVCCTYEKVYVRINRETRDVVALLNRVGGGRFMSPTYLPTCGTSAVTSTLCRFVTRRKVSIGVNGYINFLL